jgi:hypothetical protein
MVGDDMWWFRGSRQASEKEGAVPQISNARTDAVGLQRDSGDKPVDARLKSVGNAIQAHNRNKVALSMMDDDLSAELHPHVVRHGKRKIAEALEGLCEMLADNDLTLPTCPVCKVILTVEMIVFSGCTHGACEDCVKSLKDKSCPVCRTQAKSIKKLRFV